MTKGARRWTRIVGRVAYAAGAAVYGLVAAIALDAARRFDPREPRGVVGALHQLGRRPGGHLLLGLLVVGLAAQVIWRGLQAFTAIEHPHGHAPRWWTRIGWGLIGLFHAGLCWRAIAFMLHLHESGPREKRSLLAHALKHPVWRFGVYATALGLIIYAVYEWWKVWRAPFLGDFDPRRLTPARRRVLAIIGRVGLFGGGLMFGAAGVLLARSAFRVSADTIGTGDVLRHVMSGPFGAPLVAVIAVGLFAYAALMIGEAAWRRNVREPRV